MASKRKAPSIINASGPAGVPKLVSKLPSDTVNALPSVAQKMVDDPTEQFWCIAVIDTGQAVQDTDTGMVVPYVRIRKVEVVFSPADVSTAQLLLKRANEARLGKAPLEGFDDLADTSGRTEWDDEVEADRAWEAAGSTND